MHRFARPGIAIVEVNAARNLIEDLESHGERGDATLPPRSAELTSDMARRVQDSVR